MNKYLKKGLIMVGASVAVYLLLALGLTFWPSLTLAEEADTNVEETAVSTTHFTMRDGVLLSANEVVGDSDTSIVLLHGVTGSAGQFEQSAAMLNEATGATVYTLDLRGHGRSEGKSGDISYIGQYEDDVADVITAVQAQNPNGRVILGGHSMGGGIALRFAQLKDAPPVDGYLLFAPNLGSGAPTARTASADDGGDAFLQLHIPRIIGLSMLTQVGITQLNGLPTMVFNIPAPFTNVYSFRALINSSPTDYEAALTAVSAPALVLVGSADEAFVAEQYPPTFAEYTDAEVEVIAGENHNSITESDAAMQFIESWLHASHSVSQQ